jgi:hypothetical protein
MVKRLNKRRCGGKTLSPWLKNRERWVFSITTGNRDSVADDDVCLAIAIDIVNMTYPVASEMESLRVGKPPFLSLNRIDPPMVTISGIPSPFTSPNAI